MAEVWYAAIFSAFRPERIEYIEKQGDSPEKLKRLADRGVTIVRLIRDGGGFKEYEVKDPWEES